MHPTFKQVPPSCDLPSESKDFSMQAVLNPSCAALIAATYPAGPLPIITISNIKLPYKFSNKRSGDSS